ncbi:MULTISPECIES: PhoX family protein [unclassified Arthrobacter]|uniref:PhoX family protein n=1 Tax=unclassified Arthrobacter TaxID=235627 RepID=UPI002E0B9C9B|nr:MULTISPECIES: PhoX family phosphatase [unclassified Arthrobacter]MEC5189972.1 secreted PhoX family phosphatase [Arthrobacter sp. MP_M4]MEC5201440.1 secreted PhoX family phosphatase [Arthrobacter sp. MP_M7]
MSVPSGRKFSLLPMLGHTKGKRSAVTCALKCDNACSGEVCNTSSNSYFRDVASATMSRRAALGFGAAGALAVALGGSPGSAGTAVADGGPGLSAAARNGYGKSRLRFSAIAPVDAAVDALTVPDGFTWQPVIRWGDPIFKDSPDFDLGNQSAAAQARQFGYNNDYTDILEIPGCKGRRAVLFANHEYTNEAIMFPAAMAAADVRAIGAAAHGLSVVELERKNKNKPWTYVKGATLNRRYLNTTPYELTGPVAGSPLVRTTADPSGRTILGTLGNCSGGTTPWGTILSGEENFNGYFVAPGTSAADLRYGLTNKPTARQWELDDPRFDTRNPGFENEANRFGWIVEADPFDPASTPKKHSAMGRFKHEGANVIVAESGHVVAYMGDDERFDYLYKFVSKDKYKEGNRKHNMTLLSAGDLFVARFTGDSPAADIDGKGTVPSDGSFDGMGEWLPLVVGGKSAVPGMSVEDVLVYTRLAADKVGPTKMDRCEDVQPSLLTGKVYVACTNNSDRGKAGKEGATEVNPRTENRDGHIVEITETGDQTSTAFTWNLLMVCGDPSTGDVTYFSGFPADQVSPISCPDNLAFDSVGNLWISTDGAPSGIGKADGLFKVTLDGAERGRVEQFLAVPREAETCGPIIHDEERSVFVSVQHPGEDGSFADQHSFFPDYVPAGSTPARGQVRAPRPAVVQVFRGDD